MSNGKNTHALIAPHAEPGSLLEQQMIEAERLTDFVHARHAAAQQGDHRQWGYHNGEGHIYELNFFSRLLKHAFGRDTKLTWAILYIVLPLLLLGLALLGVGVIVH